MSRLSNTVLVDRFGNEIRVNEFCIVSYERASYLFCYKGLVESAWVPVKGFLIWPNWADRSYLRTSPVCVRNDNIRFIKCENPLSLLIRYSNGLQIVEEVIAKNYYKNERTPVQV